MIVKSELIHETWKTVESNIEKKRVEDTINTFINVIGNEIRSGHVVKIEGLGRFCPFTKKTKGKNINNGTIQEIPNAKYVRFIPSSKLKQ